MPAPSAFDGEVCKLVELTTAVITTVDVVSLYHRSLSLWVAGSLLCWVRDHVVGRIAKVHHMLSDCGVLPALLRRDVLSALPLH